jgi:hypothetical protein
VSQPELETPIGKPGRDHKLVEQRPDGRIPARAIAHIAPERHKVRRHLHRVRRHADDGADGGEALAFFLARQLGHGGIEHDAVPDRHARQRRLLATANLAITARLGALAMVPRHDPTPESLHVQISFHVVERRTRQVTGRGRRCVST